MIEFYPQIKQAHVLFVLASGALFLLRGSLVLAGSRFGMAAPARWLSYAIDTALLTAALMLWTILPGGMFANGWLTMKIVLLVVYVVLGSFALKRASTRRGRALCFVAALATYAFLFSVARAHHPAGVFWLLWG